MGEFARTAIRNSSYILLSLSRFNFTCRNVKGKCQRYIIIRIELSRE